jgi:polysaccharide export outer membrane protein
MTIKLNTPLILLLLITATLTSCISNKKFIYLQEKGTTKIDSAGLMPVQAYAYKIQNGDILYINLSTEDEKLNRLFVPGGGQQMMQMAQGGSGTPLYFTGFTIDAAGDLELPYLGKVHLAGLTIDESKLKVEEALKKYFKVFYLQIKIGQFKFSVIGEVRNPGQFFYMQNNVNIIEAITQAGDLGNMAERQAVQLFRQYPDGVKMHLLDLTDKQLINSPYWFIQPNDVLYVLPRNSRAIGDLSSLQSSFGIIAPLLSTLLMVLNTYILVTNLK